MGAETSGKQPDQDVVLLIDRQALTLDELVLQIFQSCVVELELALEGAVGQASAPPSMAIAWSRISSKVIATPLTPMRRAEDGMGMAQAVRT